MSFQFNLLKELRNQRRFIIELLIIVSLLGIALNLFSSALYDWIKQTSGLKGVSNEYLTIITGVIFAFCLLIGLIIFFKNKNGNHITLLLLLPFGLGDHAPVILKIKGYSPTHYANKIFLNCLTKHRHDANKLKKSLGFSEGEKIKAHEIPQDSIGETILVLVLRMIKMYSDHSLGTTGKYHLEYRNSLWDPNFGERFELKNIPIDGDRTHLPKHIILPKKTKIFVTAQGRDILFKITIKSGYSSITFEVLTDWTVITKKKSPKNWFIATRDFSSPQDTRLLGIQVRVSVKVFLKSLFSKHADKYCKWMEGLLDESRSWLCWENFKEGDMERLIVRIHSLLQKKASC